MKEVTSKQWTNTTKKLTLTAIFVAISVIGSIFSIPLFGAKCAPVLHMMNILGAIFLGPLYSVSAAFSTSLIRNLLGLGTPLAFPGSMVGAFLAAIFYKWWKNHLSAYIGEVIGTGMIGGLLAYPIAYFIMGNNQVAALTFVVPFLISSCGGTALGIIVVETLNKMGMINYLKSLQQNQTKV